MMKVVIPTMMLAVVSAYNPPLPSQRLKTSLSSTPPDVPFANQPNRRKALTHIASLATVGFAGLPAVAADSTSVVSNPILEARSIDNLLTPVPYTMEASDIFYPSCFQGSWNALSKTTNIYAPCGYELFTGGKVAYDNAVQKEVKDGDTLQYRARFVTQSTNENDTGTYVAADREYNAKEIAKAAMGSYSIVDVSTATPNRFSCVLAPPEGSDAGLVAVDILAIARKTEPITSNKFVCSEVVRQIVSPASKRNPNAPPTSPFSVKEIETISVYTIDGVVDENTKKIKCKQRTATYLVPSQTDPMMFKMYQASRGQPVDVRYYDVTYTRG
eukprot:g6697.t1 g6697   contig23:1041198-1042354(+)